MIIDFHTHTFPDELADRAVGTLAHSGGIHNYLDGRVDSFKESMKKAGIDYSVLLPVATKPNQCDTINTLALKTNETSKTTGLISFGAVHPACENFREILNWLSKNGSGFLTLLEYGFRFKRSEVSEEILHEPLDSVRGRLLDQVRNGEDTFMALIEGVDDAWEVSLLKFTVEMIQKSHEINIFDFKRKGLL